MPDKIEQIFQIVVQGLDKAVEQLNSLTTQINEAAEAKNRLNKLLSVAQDSGDKKSIDDLTARIKELNIEEEKLKNQHSALTKETNALLSVRKSLSSATEDQTKKSKSSSDQTLDEITKIKALTQQINELRIARGLARKQSEITGLPASVSIDNNTLTLKESNELEEKLFATRKKSLEILAGIESVSGRTNAELRGSLTLYEQERNALTQILENKRQALQADDPKRYTEIVNRVKELNLLIQQEKVSIDEVTAKISTQTAEYKVIVAQRQQLENIIANSKDDSVTFAGKTVSLQTANQLLDTLKIKEESYKQSLIGESAILKEMVGSKQLIILTEDKLLTAQQKELSQLTAIEKANVSKSDIILEKRLITYEQLVSRISELRAAEQKQINDEATLRNNIDLTTSSLERLQVEQQKVIGVIKQLDEASVNRTGQANVSLPSSIGGGNVNLEQALQLQESIGSQIEKQKSDLVVLRQEGVLLNAQKEKEYQLSIANLITEENSVAALTRRKNELSSLISKREEEKNVTSGTPIGFEKDLLTLEQARNKLVEINDQLVKAEQGAKGIEFLKQVSQLNALKANIDQLNASIIASANSTSKLVDFNGIFIPLDVAKARLAGMEGEFDKISNKLQIWNEEQKAINVSEEESINKLRQERIEIETILRNRASGATTVNVQSLGGEVSIDQAISRRNEIKIREDEWTQSIKLRQLSMEAALPSLQGMEASVKLLTEVLFKLNGQLSNSQWLEYRAILSSVVPEVNQLTTADVNAGNANQLLRDKIIQLNTSLRENTTDLSGRSRVVQDYTRDIINSFQQLNLGGVLQREKADIDLQINDILRRIGELSQRWKAASGTESGDAEKLRSELRALTLEYANLQRQSNQLGQAFVQTGGIASQVTRAIANGFKGLDKTIGTTLITFLGFQAAISAVTSVIRIDRQVTDQFADLQRVLGATRKEMDDLTTAVRNLDTRTSLPDLFNFAVIAARAGVATKDIAGVTQAIDRLHVVAGDSIGNIEQLTTNIIKIINVFEGTGKVTEDTVTRIGNALIQLESSGVATTEFLVNFTDRLAGVEGISKIGIKSVLGLAAAFEETGATAEVSASAITQILLRISGDITKYAALASGITDPLKIKPEQIEAYRTLVRENPGQALIQLAVGLRNNKQYLDQFAEGLGGLTARGVRITSVFGLLGANAGYFTQRIKDASAAVDGGSQLLDAYAKKQDTLAATLDKIGKEFQLAFSNPNLINSLKNIGDLILGFTRALTAIPFAVILTALSVGAAAWAYYKGQIISTTLAQNLNNRSTILGQVALVAQRIGLLGNTAAQNANTAATVAGTVAVKGFAKAEEEVVIATEAANTALEISPLGIILGVVALAIPLMSALADSMGKVAGKSRELENAAADANQKFVDQKKDFQQAASSADELLPKYIQLKRDLGLLNKDTKTFRDTQDELHDITQQLASAFPLAAKGLDEYGNVTDIVAEKVKKLVGIQKDALLAVANATVLADAKLLEEKQRQKAEADKLAEQALSGTLKLRKEVTEPSLDPLSGKTITTFKLVAATEQEKLDIIKDAQQKGKEVKAITERYFSNVDDINKRFIDEGKKVQDGVEGEKFTLEQWKQQLKIVQESINKIIEIDGGRQKFKEDLDRLLKREQEIKDTIQRLGGTTEKVSLSNVRFQRDELAEIESIRSRELAIENTRFANVQEQSKRLIAVYQQEAISIKVIHELTLGEQIQHLKNMQAINDQADEQRLLALQELHNRTERLISANSGSERERLQSQLIQQEKDIAETENKIAQRRVDTNKQTQALIEVDFREETRVEKKAMEARIAELETTFEALAKTQNIPFIVVAQAQKELHQKEFLETIESYDKLIKLGKAQGANVEAIQEDENKAIQDVIKKGLDDARAIYDSYFKDVEKKFDDQLARQNERINEVRSKILSSGLPTQQQSGLLNVSDQVEKLNNATTEFNKASSIYAQKLVDFNLGINQVSQAELDGFHAKLIEARRGIKDATDELNAGINKFGNFKETITSEFGNLLSGVFKAKPIDFTKPLADQLKAIEKAQELQKLLGSTINDIFSTASDAMNSFFDAEKNRIDASKQANLDRLATEEEIAKARAQSTAEQDSIEREFAQKKKDEDRKAFEANKKLQLEQAKINLGIQLSNLAVIATAPTPANVFSFGIVGQVLYAVQAALAVIRYFTTVSSIQSAQFTGAFGMMIGKLSNGNIITSKFSSGGEVPLRGGRFGGKSHDNGGTKFSFNNRIYEAEIDELGIIRTRNAPRGRRYKVEGTQEEIASAMNVVGGGINFRPGWKIEKFQTGGFLNSGSPSFTLQAPVASDTTPSRDSKANEELRKLIVDIVGEVKKLKDSVGQVSQNVNSVSKQTNNRIDKIQVINNATETVRVDKDRKKVINMGSINK